MSRYILARAAALGLAALTLAPALRADSVILKNGFRMRVERHEVDGPTVRLFLPGGGSAEMAAMDIDRFIPDEPEIVARPKPNPDPPVSAKPVAHIDDLIRTSSARHGLDPDLIRSMIRTESAGKTDAVSPKGAMGLMQLMPGTAKELGVGDAFDPASNVEGGTAYIRQLLDQYGHDLTLALAAYNAGPGKVQAHRGLPPYRETTAYVSRVITLFNKEKTKQEGTR